MAVLAGVGIIPAALAIRDEMEIASLENRLGTAARYADGMTFPLVDDFREPHSARARVLGALLLSLNASRQPPGTQRNALLLRAETLLNPALRTRPHWGEAQLARTVIARARFGDGAPAALAALTASYEEMPYLLPETAEWRVRYGLDVWSDLPARVQSHVLDEAVWLGHILPGRRNAVFAAARDSDGYVALGRAWRLRQLERR